MGLGSRRVAFLMPWLLQKKAGDILYATMVFLLAVLLRPRLSPLRAGVGAFGFCTAIEFSQLYHAPWIDAIRAYPLGHLVLGSGFAWPDIACYAIGVGLGMAVELLPRR